MNSKKELEILILRNFLGDLREDEKKILSQWLDASPENRQHQEKMLSSWQDGKLFRDWQRIDLQENWEEIIEKAHQEQTKTLRLRPVLKYVAAVVFLILCSVWMVNYYANTSIANDTPRPMAVLLPDGSQVWLRQDALASFHERSFKKDRSIEIEGEAFFEVQKGEVPFIVLADEGKVEVLGTTFNVRENESSTEVLLLEGSVRFSAAGSEQILKPGEGAISDGRRIQVIPQVNVNSVGWKTGVFRFSNQPLREVMEVAAGYYGFSHEMSKAVEDLRVTAAFNKNSLSEFMEELSFILGIEIKATENKLTITKE
ncbi:FecR family protein [Cyclobacterium plantarum]|uniref:FecR family protein n=1 Tax=Cyclobacterium plantarum TaxID=2716263 RepID=UPI003F6F10DC